MFIKLKEKGKELSNDEDAAKLQDDKHTKCLKIQIQLKDSGYKDKVMKECKEYFYDKEFNEKLNDQKHLIGFENGIYDLNNSIFRGGLPSDYISLSTGITLPVVASDLPINIDDLIEESKCIDDYDVLNYALDDFLEKVFHLLERPQILRSIF